MGKWIDKWTEKREAIEAIEAYGDSELEAEKEAAKTFGAKINWTLKSWVWRAIGFFTAPLGWALMWGLETFTSVSQEEIETSAKDTLTAMKEHLDLSPGMATLIDDMLAAKSPIAPIVWIIIAILSFILGALGVTMPTARLGGFSVDKRLHSGRLGANEAVPAYFRDALSPTQLEDNLADQGFDDTLIKAVIAAYRSIFTPGELRDLWHRKGGDPLWYDLQLKKLGYEEGDWPLVKELWPTLPMVFNIRDLFLRGELEPGEEITRLEKLGYSTDDAEKIKKLFYIVPPVADMVRFADFGSFDPEIIEMWREYYDAPDWISEPMSLAGIGNEPPWDWANKYWFSHWRQPGRFELGEMRRRNLIDDQIVKNAYLTQGFSAFWQESLLKLVEEPWTRVDVRRMWDMRTISEEQLRKAYEWLGYAGEQLEGMMLWTKVYVAFPDLIARYTKGWITEEEVKAELIDLGMPEERAQEMIETKVKKAKTDMPETEESRDFTKSEILDGYRRELFTEEETRTMLTELNYGLEQVNFFLRREDLKKEQDLREAYVKRYENLYVEGMITWADAAEALSIVGLMEAEIRELEPLWEMKRMVRIAHPSRADLDRFLKKGIIDDLTYRDEMRKMGYSDLYITWYLWSLLLEEAS